MTEHNWTTTIHPDPPAAVTATGVGNVFDVRDATGGLFQVEVSASSGTSPTLLVKIQICIDGTNWFDLDATNAVTASITTTGRALIRVYPGLTNTAAGTANAVLPSLCRFAWTVGGVASPSFTIATHVALIP